MGTSGLSVAVNPVNETETDGSRWWPDPCVEVAHDAEPEVADFIHVQSHDAGEP
jgi:hypothetical protein